MDIDKIYKEYMFYDRHTIAKINTPAFLNRDSNGFKNQCLGRLNLLLYPRVTLSVSLNSNPKLTVGNNSVNFFVV